MRWARRALRRVASLFGGREAADADVRAEMEAHLHMEMEANIRRGMSPAEARRQALLAAGGMSQAAERVREERGLPWLESFAADARYALRHFRRTPLATLTMVLVLSLGMGTVVVVSTMLNSLATMPAPGIARDDALVRIRGTLRGEATGLQPRLLSWPEVRAYAARADLFEAVAAFAYETALVESAPGEEAPVRVVYATSNYFELLGVRPALGRAPIGEPGDTRLATSPTAVISHAMWRRWFGGDAGVVGRTVRVNDFPVEIVGVAPPAFAGTEGAQDVVMWVPLGAYPLLERRTPGVFLSADSLFLATAARLRPGVAPGAATPAVAGIAASVTGPGLAPGESAGADVVPLLAANARVSSRWTCCSPARCRAGSRCWSCSSRARP